MIHAFWSSIGHHAGTLAWHLTPVAVILAVAWHKTRRLRASTRRGAR